MKINPPPIPSISEAEAVVMETLWSENPLSAEQVMQSLAASQSWHESTIKTLLNRLLKKGAIVASLEGRRYLYSPVLRRDQWQVAESTGFIDRVFGGQIAPLFAHLSQHRRLSKADLRELRKLIEGMSDGQ
nr:BlaI/MecI/CopY family transcriptional regulator [Rhodoferax sp.]